MTAGRGIIHEEYHSKKFTQEGGTFGKRQRVLKLPVPRFPSIMQSNSETHLIRSLFTNAVQQRNVPIVGQFAQKAQNDQTEIPANFEGSNSKCSIAIADPG